ncbi:VOC family protein [Garicola koreensis]|uniref:VOC family protein n=1 Tax=Garicola koreensis TaxID=1262554 RepID=UPI0031E8D31C
MSSTLQITFDAHDPRGLSIFWREVLGYVHPFPPGAEPPAGTDPLAAWDEFLEQADVPQHLRNSSSALEDPDGTGPRIFFQQVPEHKTAKNRVHLDVRTATELRGEERMAALEGECQRLMELGGTRMERHDPQPPISIGFIVMADPEGNEFCLD